MRVTKTMREYIEKKLDERRIAADRKASEAYQVRRKDCIAELEQVLASAWSEGQKILEKYGMDTLETDYRGASDGTSAIETIFKFCDGNVINYKEKSAIREAEHARYQKQRDLMEEIIFDAEAGGNKDSLLAAIASISFED